MKKTHKRRRFRRRLRPLKTIGRWLLLGMAHMVLLATMGYYGLQIKTKIEQHSLNLDRSDIAAPVVTRNSKSFSVPPDFYKGIWERNLFQPLQAEKPPPTKPAPEPPKPAHLTLADLGYELKGTAVFGDSEKEAIAVIYKHKARYEEEYRVGDLIGPAVIKSISRDRVVLASLHSNESLMLGMDGYSRIVPADRALKTIPYPIKAAPRFPPRTHHRKVDIDRQKLETSVAKSNQYWKQVQLTPYQQGSQPEGLLIKGLKYKNVLFQMGLRNGDVIKSLNGEKLTGTDQIECLVGDTLESSGCRIGLLRGKSDVLLKVKVL